MNGRPPDAFGADLSLNSDPSDDDELKPRSRESRTRPSQRPRADRREPLAHELLLWKFPRRRRPLLRRPGAQPSSSGPRDGEPRLIWLGERAPSASPSSCLPRRRGRRRRPRRLRLRLRLDLQDGLRRRPRLRAVLAAAGALYVAWRHESFPRALRAPRRSHAMASSRGGGGRRRRRRPPRRPPRPRRAPAVAGRHPHADPRPTRPPGPSTSRVAFNDEALPRPRGAGSGYFSAARRASTPPRPSWRGPSWRPSSPWAAAG